MKKINLKIKKGDVIGVMGRSGSGKSTLLKILTGLIRPDSGSVEIDGIDIFKEDKKIFHLIGYVPQFVYLLDDKIKNNVAFGIEESKIDLAKIRSSIKMAQLDNFINLKKDGIESIVGEKGIKISGGQRQRIGIARALYRDPELLIFDEPTSSLDEETEINFLIAFII